MAQEDHNLGCSYSGAGGGRGGGGGGGGGGSSGGGGGCSSTKSKKMKQKKVPQRGLGVAQLEKIRIEEQHKKESLQAANILAKNAVASSADSNSFLGVQKFRQAVSPFHNSVPPPPPPPPDFNPPYRHLPNLEIMPESYLHVSKQTNAAGVRDKLLRLDHHGFPFDPHSYQQFHHPSPSSMMQVNSSPSSGILQSSVVNSQMEPPSNQSFRSNSYATLWTEEDEVIGMKRSYPFTLDSPSAPSSHRSFHPIYAASSSSKLDDLALCNNDRMESRNKCIRLGPSNSSPLPETIRNEVNVDDGKINADFLTLAPPSIASPPLISKHMHPLSYSGHDYEGRPNQEYTKSQIHQPGSADKTFSFFPTKVQINGSTPNESTGNGENGEKIDLNLKL